MQPVANLDLGDGLHMRALGTDDAGPLAEAATRNAEQDSWHDCLIWAHVSDQAPGAGCLR